MSYGAITFYNTSDTNIVIFSLPVAHSVTEVLAQLKAEGLLAVPFGKHEIRLVTHLDFDDNQLEQSLAILAKVLG
jgi:threonine aldolase